MKKAHDEIDFVPYYMMKRAPVEIEVGASFDDCLNVARRRFEQTSRRNERRSNN